MHASDVQARFRVIFVIWAALLLGVTLFSAVAWALVSGRVGDGTWTPVLEPGVVKNLLGAPILLMVAGIFYRRGEVRRSGDTEVDIQRYQTRVVVASAMQEGGGLLGVVLCLLAGMAEWTLGIWGLTAVAMTLSRPRVADLDDMTT